MSNVKDGIPLIAEQIVKEDNEGKAIGLGLLSVATAIIHLAETLKEIVDEGILSHSH